METAVSLPPPRIETSPSGLQLVDSDIELFSYLDELGLAHLDHLALLAGRSYKKVQERLSKLYDHGYVARIAPPLQKHIYTLAKRGIAALVERGLAPAEQLNRRLRHHELKPLFLDHALMITDIHVRLMLENTSGKKLVRWKEGKELFDKIEALVDDHYEEIPIRPDAFFTVEDTQRPPGQNRSHFFLEADRSTMSHDRMRRKYLGYWEYLTSGAYTKKYGFRSFRVMTVTLTEERAENLRQLAEKALAVEGHRCVLFTLANEPICCEL